MERDHRSDSYCRLKDLVLVPYFILVVSSLFIAFFTSDDSVHKREHLTMELPDLHHFPREFMWGTSTAAYQIEGANEEEGRGRSVWDELREIPGRIRDNSSPQLSCEGYKKWKEDIGILKELGVSHYRFSISWTRIFPNGKREKVNEKGIDHYRKFCEELVKNGIQPIITLVHLDYPTELYTEGGWMNPDSIDWFTDFATICFENFGDLVKTWITFNEIPNDAWRGIVKINGQPDHSLNMNTTKWNVTNRQVPYLAAHRMLLAHAKAYRIYKDKYFPQQQGKVGIVAGARWTIAAAGGNNEEAQERAFTWNFRWTVDPIFGSEGDYPEVMRDRLDELAKKEGLPYIMPKFTAEERSMMKGSADFLGLNYYITMIVGERGWTKSAEYSQIEEDGDYDYYPDTFERISGSSSWLRYAPFGLHANLVYIKDHYNNIPTIIVENGCADVIPSTGNLLNDQHRIRFMKGHIEAVSEALSSGCDIRGYFAWSLMDNFEWSDGFATKFGLYHVDFDSENKTRTPKDSAKYYKHLMSEAHKLHE